MMMFFSSINSEPEEIVIDVPSEQAPKSETMSSDINFDDLKKELGLLKKRVVELKIEKMELEKEEEEVVEDTNKDAKVVEEDFEEVFLNKVLGFNDSVQETVQEFIDSFMSFIDNVYSCFVKPTEVVEDDDEIVLLTQD